MPDSVAHNVASNESRATKGSDGSHAWQDYLVCRAKGWTMDKSLDHAGMSRHDRARILWPGNPAGSSHGADDEMLALEAAAIRAGAVGDARQLAEALLAAAAPRMVARLVETADNPDAPPAVRISAADKALQRAGVGVPKQSTQSAGGVQIVFITEGGADPPKVIVAEQPAPGEAETPL